MGNVVFDQVEVLDYCGPFEVFSVMRSSNQESPNKLFQPVLISKTLNPITTIGGMKVLPDCTYQQVLDEQIPIHVLLIPGGIGSRQERYHTETTFFVQQMVQRDSLRVLASVCTGILILAQARVLPNQQKVATHYQALDYVQTEYPNLQVHRDVHWTHEHITLSSSLSLSTTCP